MADTSDKITDTLNLNELLKVEVTTLTSGEPTDAEPELLNVLCNCEFARAVRLFSHGKIVYMRKNVHEMKEYNKDQLKKLSDDLLKYIKESKFVEKMDYSLAVSDGAGAIVLLTPGNVTLADV